MSPDPKASSAKPSNPQTWNRYTYALQNPLRFIDPDGLEYVDKQGKRLAEQCKSKCNEKQKKDVEKADKSATKISTEVSSNAAFATVDPKTHERGETKEVDVGNKKGRDEAQQIVNDIKAGKSDLKLITGTNDPNPDGSKTVTIFAGSQQFSPGDSGMTKGQFILTVFAHESFEAIGGTHREATAHEKP